MENDNKNVPTPEELQAEQAALVESKEDEIRANVIAEFGFDEAADADRIDKLVTKEIESAKKLSAAIGQKINYRTKLQEASKDIAPKPEVKPTDPADIEKIIATTLEKRDLDSLEYSAELKKEIQRVAQITGVSVKQAARDPYIVAKIGDWEKTQKAEEAAISRTNRSSGKKNYSIDNPPELDMSTPEGRKEWDDYKEAMRKAGN